MRRRAKVKANGRIIEVRPSMDYEGNTTWIEDLTDTEYYPLELEFFPVLVGKAQSINSDEPFTPEDIITLPPIEMKQDPTNHTVYFIQDMCARMSQEAVATVPTVATEQQLKDELKRRRHDAK